MIEIEESERRSGWVVGLLGLAYVLYGGACAALLGAILLTGLQALPAERLLPLYCGVGLCALAPLLLLIVTGCGLWGGHGRARRLAYALPVALLPLAAWWCGQGVRARPNDPGAAAELMSGLGLGAFVALPGAAILAALLWATERAGGAGKRWD